MSGFDQHSSKTGRDQYNAAGDITIKKDGPNWELYCPSKGKCPGLAQIGKIPECYIEYSGAFMAASGTHRLKITEVFYKKYGMRESSKKMKMESGGFLQSLVGLVSGIGGMAAFKEHAEKGQFELYKCPLCDSYILYELIAQEDGRSKRERVGELMAGEKV